MSNLRYNAALIGFSLGFTLIFTFFLSDSLASSGSRPYDPVIVEGSSVPNFTGVSVDSIYVYTFLGGVWAQIPYQIDEKDGGSWFFGTKNNKLNATDEICFMAADMGDSVGNDQWISDLDSRTYDRYQISFTDTSTTPDQRAYAYIYRSNTLNYNAVPASYVSYKKAVSPAVSDTIKGTSYAFADSNAIPVYLSILPAVGGTDTDIMDRWKIYFKGTISAGFYTISYEENEETGLTNPRIYYQSPPDDVRVRVIRRSVFQPVFAATPLPDSLSLVTTFYPYFSYMNTSDRSLEAPMGVQVLRQSVDYKQNIIGSKFYSKYNPAGLDVDGISDAAVSTLDVPGVNWYMIQGSMGTIATYVDMPVPVGNDQKLYYKDNNIININDTGDKRAFGESGIQVQSLPPDPPITGTFLVESTFFYLGPNHTTSIADSLLTFFTQPCVTGVRSNTFVIPVELAAFTSKVNKNNIELQWSTASESNNYGFEIHRKTETTDWETIAFIEGAGTTNKAQSYRFLDQNLSINHYFYRLKQIDVDGQFEYSPVIEATIAAPSQFRLSQNYPNPFNPKTQVAFEIPEEYSGHVELNIYNIVGQKIRTLVSNELSPGYYEKSWDGRDDQGHSVGAGTFIYQLKAQEFSATHKMIKLD